VVDAIPSRGSLRWPILVVLDGVGEDDLLELEDRVLRHLALPDDARSIVDPATDRSLVTRRLVLAIEDLYQAGAIEPDVDRGSIRITGDGRRLTEALARDLSEVDDANLEIPEPVLTDKQETSVGDWIFAILSGLG
jgi:hypothetical protein